MSDPAQIEEHIVNQFADNVFELAQQKSARALPTVTRRETFNGTAKSFDSIGLLEMQDKTTRLGQTEHQFLERNRRWVMPRTSSLATVTDTVDKLKMIHDPTSDQSMAAQGAYGRKLDDKYFAAVFAPAYIGKDAPTGTVPWAKVDLDGTPAGAAALANTVRGDYDSLTNPASQTAVGLTVPKLIAAKQILMAKEAWGDDGESMAHIFASSDEIAGLLNEDKLTNADYAAVKALVHGEVNTFMGFNFIRSERLLKTTRDYGGGAGVQTIRRCVAVTPRAMGFGTNEGLFKRQSERDDLEYAVQLFLRETSDFVRIEDEHVVEIETLAL